jgi:hypothetical protein
MTWVAVAIGGAAVVGAVGSNMAAGTQAAGQRAAANTQAGMFNTITGQEQPFINAGYDSSKQLNQMMAPGGYLSQTFSPKDLENYPGYQFQKQQGQLALESGNTPGVGAVSGPALKSLMNYNQGLAGTTYGTAFNQFQTQQNNIFDRLNQIATRGQNAAGNLGTAGTTLGTGIAQAQAGAAASQAGGIVGATNSIAGAGVPLAYLMNNNQAGGGGVSDPSMSTPYGSGGNTGTSYCDYAMKCEIEPYRFNGTSNLMVYDFEYKAAPGTKHRGYIAQEVQEQYPQAVSRGPQGYLKIDYSKLPGWDELDNIADDF